jgi:hypothetical protein
MIQFYRNRAVHENDIDQLKNGVKALAPASDSLLSNWALNNQKTADSFAFKRTILPAYMPLAR